MKNKAKRKKGAVLQLFFKLQFQSLQKNKETPFFLFFSTVHPSPSQKDDQGNPENE
jgi:hypothetical protein